MSQAVATSKMAMPTTRTRLYLDLLQSLALSLEDPSVQVFLQDISVAFLIAEQSELRSTSSANSDSLRRNGLFDGQELAAYGTPVRRHLGPAIRQRLLSDIQAILCSIAEYLGGDVDVTEDYPDEERNIPSTLLEQIVFRQDEVVSLKDELETTTMHVSQLIDDIAQNRKGLEDELTKAIASTFPLHDAARSASVDLLCATIEASLIKLSLVKEQTERSLYSHRPKSKGERTPANLADAVTAAYTSLKEDEKKMKVEIATLDRELLEYESMLRLVDGNNGGYQQVINDWTKVQQETDECLKDLRRLGWTGD